MKKVLFIKDHCNYKSGDTIEFIVDNHADSLIAKGVATDNLQIAEKPKKPQKK
jgi:hypothetical protein